MPLESVVLIRPNKALQLTANALRGLSAAELGRYAAVELIAGRPENRICLQTKYRFSH